MGFGFGFMEFGFMGYGVPVGCWSGLIAQP